MQPIGPGPHQDVKIKKHLVIISVSLLLSHYCEEKEAKELANEVRESAQRYHPNERRVEADPSPLFRLKGSLSRASETNLVSPKGASLYPV